MNKKDQAQQALQAKLTAAYATMEKRITHPRIKDAIDEIKTQLSLGKGHIILVTGPAGVGKTTLSQTLEVDLQKRYLSEMNNNPGLIPVLKVEARATSEKNFNWKLFYNTILSQLEMSMDAPAGVAYGIDPHTNHMYRPLGHSKNTTDGLRAKVEYALRARGVKVLMIDEGGHLTNVSDSQMKRQTDALKSLSNCAECQIILFGSYDILGVSRLSGQLARRIEEIHFSRYKVDVADDVQSFYVFLETLESRCGGLFGGLLTENAPTLQENTLGCIGNLMTIVRKFVAQIQRTSTVTQGLLNRCLLTPGQHTRILEEIQWGEQCFDNETISTKEVRRPE